MRVVHVLADARRLGGAEAHVFALADLQRQRGDDVSIVDASANGSLNALLRKPDVVHVHGDPLAPEAQAELGRELSVVRSFHDFAFACAAGHHWLRGGDICTRAHGPGCLAVIALRGCAHRRDPRPAFRRYTTIERSLPVARTARAVVVYSDYMRRVGLDNGIDPATCHTIPYFVEAGTESPAPGHPRTIAYAGRLSASKGVDVLLRALACEPDAWETLDVAGDGPERARLERLAGTLGIGARVRWRGWLDEAGTREAMLAAGQVVIPSRWPEPFGIVGIEAMALGRPVVASAVGGVPEWLTDGETGVLVPPGDVERLAAAVAGLATNEPLARRLGDEGRRRVGRFSPDAHLARLDAVYAEAVS